MVNSLLFRWEDSQALKHHCGFCERPLSHPGARASCFGKHSEPCVRFHQAMFMRLRGHTCTFCLSIDEAHYKRHHDIAGHLRSVYESCGEVDWNIIPLEPDAEDRGRVREPSDSSGGGKEADRSITPEDTPSSKRERKDAKRLARAASRSRVVTQDEIRYIDSILHSAEGISGNESDGPRNPEEVEEIERQLRYHAHVYNTQPTRHGLKKLAESPEDTAVNFDLEMERILDTFRISELIKRNTKTKGLQGKELRVFLALVDTLKQAVIEDIVQVKKDVAEVRMRRAGYLRYTNKTSYNIVEDRYTNKDWKTGEKFTSSESNSSDAITPNEEIDPTSHMAKENQPPHLPSAVQTPDRRHLRNTHKRVSGDDGLDGTIVEPYHAPLLPYSPIPAPNKKVMTMKLVPTKLPDLATSMERGGPGRRSAPRQDLDGWQTVKNGADPTASVGKPSVWGNVPKTRPREESRPILSTLRSNETAFPGLPTSTRSPSDESTTKAHAVQAPSVWASKEPESFIAETPQSTNDHPAVSQRKQAKKAREAKRKAKKATAPVDLVSDATVGNDALEEVKEKVSVLQNVTSEVVFDNGEIHGGQKLRLLHALQEEIEIELSFEATGSDSTPSEIPLQVTKHGKHVHWTRYTRKFLVDQLTGPDFSSLSGCSPGTSCVFESNDVVDCPFHAPHCPCVDPMTDNCYLVLPCANPCSSGPYNRLRGEKLLSLYETDSRTKGHLMLVDDDLVDYFLEDPACRCIQDMPPRLAKEYEVFSDGYNPGPLMGQERQFERLWARNQATKQELTQKMLEQIQRDKFEPAATKYMCYCRATIPKRGALAKDTVICSHSGCPTVIFHKSCVKKLGVEKVSRWYCTTCESQMKRAACKVLRELGYTDIPVDKSTAIATEYDEEMLQQIFEEKLDALMDMPQHEYEKLMPPEVRERVRELGGFNSMPSEFKAQLRENMLSMSTRLKGLSLKTYEA